MRSRNVVKVVGPLTVLLTVGLLAAGCGGSRGPGPPTVAPSPPQVETQNLGCSFYLLDFTTGEVELLAPDDPRIPEPDPEEQVSPQAVVTGPGYADRALRLTRSKLLSDTGSPGRYVWHMTIENQSDETFGAHSDGTVTGIEILVPVIVFKDASNNPVNGGGTYGWTALNPVIGTPVYNTGQKLDPGETLEYDNVQFSLPEGATKAAVGLLLRADTAYVHVPGLGECYVTTIAGTQTAGTQTGPVGAAAFDYPYGLTVDDNGDIYACDADNNYVVKVSAGQVSVLAGDGTTGDENDLHRPHGCQFYYGGGYLVVSEELGDQISLVSMAGNVYRIAGSAAGASGNVDGDGDTARFNVPTGVDVLGDTIYVADYGNNSIRTVRYIGDGSRASPSSYEIDTIATGLSDPISVCVDGQGNVFFTDRAAHKIYVIPRGSGTKHVIAGGAGGGYQNGMGDVARFSGPYGIDDDGAGNLYIADRGNRRIRLMYMTGADITQASHWTVTTLAGTGALAIQDGVGSLAKLRSPSQLRVGPSGTVFFSGSHYLGRVDRITPPVPY